MIQQAKFIILHIKSIALAGAILWVLVLLSLDIAGIVDVKADCPLCATLIEKLIPNAFALDRPSLNTADGLPLLSVRLTFLPK